MRYLAVIALALITIAVAIVASQGRASQNNPPTEYSGPRQADKAVIIIHGGGYLINSNEETKDSARAFARAGYRAINLSYPLGDLAGARDAVDRAIKQAKRKHRRVYLYGESAGGGLAALALARGLADGGYAWAPVSDLVTWKPYTEKEELIDWTEFKDSSPETLKQLSAINYASDKSSPILVVHGRNDKTVLFTQSLRLRARYPQMKLIKASGGHESDARSRRTSTARALRCFAGGCPWANE